MIRVKEVVVIGDDGKQHGVMPVYQALALARDADLDLVEVAPNVRPPVCKIMDYGKYKYKLNKKEHEGKKKQKVIKVKEVKMTPKTDEHDYQFKVRHVKRFLTGGDKTKIVIVFKGREIVHSELGRNMLERIIEDTRDVGVVEQPPKREGYNMIMILMPKS
ncbi:MAG: translation initiation factor IF-3 [Nitrospinae bacterium RIFCSPLOWO2_02_FULL_39_110]|nr:MAG: translation initiation factor IF-3 [Nitrospinae bacterium RIFCSPHIGHO2_02_39_11]OGV98787.1 MAG: translation initiation factor IF-3 [Nitrospinae bacterium RIFCSPHIGHO2_12_FULL_39_42]OGV99902.1 MAG: translation initiation factor IF-3 [Nitrospinae bacterium RIFCSPHIGHO2_02_FULL_39_82]OGW04147.1 MAG: translation initiation factor IF-3 [Nitrospinae bacterium RIFCSPLOWO2_02_FULL_39_110]OGW06482.1 MAG: translation initiation factor IF-3 [Nitrospinae bacterium RIFCSPLOWO2_02_39_17]OGW09161.1 M